MSEREPELGLGLVTELDHNRITVEFPATREKRIYARGTPVLKRVQFNVGDKIATREGASFTIETVTEENGVLIYAGSDKRVPESGISDITSVSSPAERLMAGQADPSEVFDLRLRTLENQSRLRQSAVRGYLGGRIDLIPHQFYILHEVASRHIPRVLLADEVGLGKTIEACLILQRLLVIGRVKRALILVPESLVHQWFVELLRRFNLWFTIFDEPRCLACEESEPDKNPFQSSQLGLASVSYLAGSESRKEQIVAAGWDLVIVDEAHHLAWNQQESSADYQLVEQLAQNCPGLLLLTATPTQLGLTGHFARLRLLDPHRYDDYQTFLEESDRFGAVAAIADKIIAHQPLTTKDHTTLRKIFDRDPAGLDAHLEALSAGKPGASEALLRTLLDQHGTGRVVFRNTRAAMTGFPKRKYCPAALADGSPTLLTRIARELQAEETGDHESIRYSFKDDPRIDWLIKLLKSHSSAKILLICKTERKVLALEAAIKERLNLNLALFHEGLPLVQRDRQAAWFAEPNGAQLLICSEIGSEGRNFQFAHHLVLFDLPLNPGLVEQRIGRLDRIGQTQTIRIHVPYLTGSADEAVAEWFHRGLDAFETSLHGGNEYYQNYHERLLKLAVDYGEGRLKETAQTKLESFIKETAKFHGVLAEKLKSGRDHLLELNSFNGTVANEVIERVRGADGDPRLKTFLTELLDHFGVRVTDHEEGDITLNADHAYVEGFPSIPRDGMLATYDRSRAIVREDIRFLSADHALVQDTIDLLIDSPAGTTAFCLQEADKPNLLLEAVFVLETMAEARWHVDQFLAPTPVRVLVDIHGRDLTDERDTFSLAREITDAPLPRFLEKPGFNSTLLKNLLEAATERATTRTLSLKQTARETAAAVLTADLQRLVTLGKLNENVLPEEIDLAKKQVRQTRTAIEQARLRLDSIRLIVEGVDL